MHSVQSLELLHPSKRWENGDRREYDVQNRYLWNKLPQHYQERMQSFLSQDGESLSYCIEYHDVLILFLVL